MKTVLVFMLLVPFIAVSGDPAAVSPEKPLPDKAVTIYYDPSADRAVLRQPEEIDLYVLFWYPDLETPPVFHSYAMEEKEGKWKTTITLEDEALRAVQFKFVSGEHSDDNNGRFWDFPLYDENGNVLPDGYFTLARTWMPDMGLRLPTRNLEMFREMNMEKVSEYATREFGRDPGHGIAGVVYLNSLMMQMREADDPEELKKRGLEVAADIYERFRDEPMFLQPLVWVFRSFGDPDKASAVQEYLEERYPDHDEVIAMRMGEEMSEIFQARGQEERIIELIGDFLEKYPDAEQAEMLISTIYLPSLVESGRVDEAVRWLEEYEHPTAQMYWRLANALVAEDGDPGLLLPTAKKALDLFRAHPPVEKPSYVTPGDWERFKDTFTRMEIGIPEQSFYHTYATALWRSGDLEPALEYIRQAYDLAEGTSVRTNTRYVEILNSAEQYEKALEIGRTAIVMNQSEELLYERMEDAYVALNETDDGFAEFLEEARAETAFALREKFLDRMIEEPAPDFTLVQLDGEPVTLSDLEGKVVVLDFWATWCGPCVSAFPHFQRVVEYFGDNPDVVFLAINTWEGDYDEERIEKVRNFIEENEYTFTVLFDEDTVVSEYGVQGIPTRFTLDREGVIRFEDRGFSGAGMYNDMIVQIEMLLEGVGPLTEL